jgi:hypothetical protein
MGTWSIVSHTNVISCTRIRSRSDDRSRDAKGNSEDAAWWSINVLELGPRIGPEVPARGRNGVWQSVGRFGSIESSSGSRERP